jgi:hypothetical protein
LKSFGTKTNTFKSSRRAPLRCPSQVRHASPLQ